MRYSGKCCGCLVVVLVAVGEVEVAARPFSTNSTVISNSTHIGVEASDAITLTTVSWTKQGRVAVYFDRRATNALRFEPVDTPARYLFDGADVVRAPV